MSRLTIKIIDYEKDELSFFILAAGFAVSAQDTTMSSMSNSGMGTSPRLRTPMALKTRIGLKGGVNLAHYSAKEFVQTPDPSTNDKTSFHIGAFVNIPLGGMFKLQPELIYSDQGSKMEETRTVGSTTTTYNYEEALDYINLPVMFQLQTTGGFFVETGTQFSLAIQSTAKGTTPYSTTDKTNISDRRDKFDIAWALGVGYLSRIGLGVGARYNYGIRNIVNENDVNIGELRNRVLQFSLFYQFGAYK